MALRLAFMGTPDFSVPVLEALYAAGHEIVAVYSQPPRPAGRRGLEVTPSPVQKAAEALHLPIYTPQNLKSSIEQQKFRDLNIDAAIVVAYGLLLPKAILETPLYGCFNGHASLLPRWRGAAPIQRAIMAGDKETGIMIMKMDEGLDTGPVALTKTVAITPYMTAGVLHDTLSQTCAPLMVEAMSQLEQKTLVLTPQSQEGVTYAHKIQKEEARIDWSQSAHHIQHQICGLSPYPGSWCEMVLSGKRERVKLLQARLSHIASKGIGHVDPQSLIIGCGQGSIQIIQLQKSGGKILNHDDFIRGFHVTKVF
ncbi:methionyl-tRNA formyltransferase [Bartonella tamiae]|uniref:Methionyl-tRNA formyltransferase n=1 Tax=Bartonella tamiae Th239 TaxID=1094558 RepID=J0ZR27_9HYPH|nr:methionyl-tRNA formyltransferase [Bartonella tamiae]EJF91138.1 methionyl-tRNA formyltransferase [Bartonella tamiae Th239]EJF93197.1 methionyl-tRNA formyltransferase [Bartonella tamiae Th307]